MKPCQYDKNLVAAGCLNGSITIFSLETMMTVHHINIHDHEVTSLDWLNVAVEVKEEERKIIKARDPAKNKVQELQRPRLAELADDPFDIYAFDENEVEFGTIVDKRPSEYYLKHEQSQPPPQVHEDFNFLEECQNLKDNILEKVEEPEDSHENDVTSEEPNTRDDEPRTPRLAYLLFKNTLSYNFFILVLKN